MTTRNIFKFMSPIDPSGFPGIIKEYRFIVVHFRINYLLYHLAAIIVIHLYIDGITKLIEDNLFKELYVDKYGQEQYFQIESPRGKSQLQSPKCRVLSAKVQSLSTVFIRAESQV